MRRARAASSALRPPMRAARRARTMGRLRLVEAASSMKFTITRRAAAMLKTGSEHLRQLRDGRVVYIGAEKVDDVTTHPAFRNAARSIASIYDIKEPLSHEEGGERYSDYFLRARTKGDLETRRSIHEKIAQTSYGLLGVSPDHVASFVTGMAMNPAVFGKFSGNLLRYYEHMRHED